MINFILQKSKNYALVQKSILSAIQKHLPPDAWTSSVLERRPGHLNFSLFVRLPAEVVMSHGVADKNYFTDVFDDEGQLYARRLKHVLVPGPWLKRKLLAFPGLDLTDKQVHTVGWPRIDMLRRLAAKTAEAAAAETPAEPAPARRTRVLWAPTHDFTKRGEEQLSTSSYPALQEHLPRLQEVFEVEVSLHPRNRDDKQPTDLPLVRADCVISDFGTMVYEAWALGKPVIFPRWLLGDRIQQYLPGSAEAHIFEARIGYHPGSLDEMIEILRSGPVVGDDVREFLRDYLDNAESAGSAKRIAKLLLSLEAKRAKRAADKAAEKAAAKAAAAAAAPTPAATAPATEGALVAPAADEPPAGDADVPSPPSVPEPPATP